MKGKLSTLHLFAGLLAPTILLFVMSCSILVGAPAMYPPTSVPVALASKDTLSPFVKATPASMGPAPAAMPSTDTFTSPPPSPTPMPPGQPYFGPITFGPGVAADGRVSNPTSQFPAGVQEVYAVWPYYNMGDGLRVTRRWYHDGVNWLTREEMWDYNQHGSNGIVTWVKVYDYFDGLTGGDYRLELYIGDRLQQTASFAVGYGPPGPTPYPPPTVSPGQREARVTASYLDIRQGPAAQSPSIWLAPYGTVVLVLGGPQWADNTPWYRVQVKGSQTVGWCDGNYLDFQWPEPSPGQPYFGPITFGPGVAADGRVSNPTSQFPAGVQEVYAVWPYYNMGDGLRVTRRWYHDGVNWLTREEMWDYNQHGSNGIVTWVKVYDYFDGLTGGDYRLELYIGDRLQQTASFAVGYGPPGPTPYPPYPAPTVSPGQGEARVIDGPLNVRQGPGTWYPVVRSIPYGAVVLVLEGPRWVDIHPWYRVQVKGGQTVGWCSGRYLHCPAWGGQSYNVTSCR